jgi:glucan phosphoethanolaminetransferase (alkaline phosphatase superfamily)
MELEELKSIWKSSDPGFSPKNEAEIAQMLKGNSQSIVDKLKRSVWFELVFTLVAGIALLVYALTLPSGALKWTSVSILVLFVGYSFYYIKKLTLLVKYNPAAENIRASLERLTDNLSSYLRFYKRSYTLLYPIYFVLGLLFVAMERGMDKFLANLSQPRTIIYLLAIGLVFFFCSTWLTNWYLKKLYGNHLEKLKGLLHDIKQ